MNLSLLLANQIAIMGVMILFGFITGRAKLVSLADSSSISKITLYLVGPCMTISALQTSFSKEKAIGYFLALAAAAVIHGIFLLLALVTSRIFHLNNVEKASFIYTNCGNLIIPIINYMLGEEYVLYTCAYLTVQTIMLWTHGVSVISEENQISVRKILLNPNIIAMAVGLLLFFCGISIPEIPLAAIKRMGDCIGPISMIVIGIMLGDANLKIVFGNGRSWLVSGIRLILCPMAVLVFFWITHATKLTPEAGKVLFISFLAAAAPSASSVSQMANVWHKNEIQAGCINMLSVLLCMITMPLMTYFYQLLCM